MIVANLQIESYNIEIALMKRVLEYIGTNNVQALKFCTVVNSFDFNQKN